MIADFSKKLDVQTLYEYANTVKESTDEYLIMSYNCKTFSRSVIFIVTSVINRLILPNGKIF